MMLLKKVMINKNLKKAVAKYVKPKYLLLGVAIILCLAIIAYILRINYEMAHPPKNQFVQGLNEPDMAYKSLNLNVASKATYSSAAMTIAKDLGISNGVRHQIVHFSVAKDKLIESALLTLPTTPQPAEGYPVIILCHGYVNPIYYSTEKAYLPDMQFYSQNGYAVVKPDYRGQGYSLSAGAPEGAYYSMAYNTDVLSLVASVKQTKYLDGSNINLWGHSMGAYIALRASVLSKDIKNTILLAGPIGYIQDMFSAYVAISDTNNATAGSIRTAELAAHNTPIANPKFWNTTSPINYLKNTKSFYQIHVGTADQIVPPQFSADFDAALSKNRIPHEYFVYQGADHGLMRVRASIWQRSLARMNQ